MAASSERRGVGGEKGSARPAQGGSSPTPEDALRRILRLKEHL